MHVRTVATDKLAATATSADAAAVAVVKATFISYSNVVCYSASRLPVFCRSSRSNQGCTWPPVTLALLLSPTQTDYCSSTTFFCSVVFPGF